MVHTSWVVIAMIAVTAQSAFGCGEYLEGEGPSGHLRPERLTLPDFVAADAIFRQRKGLKPKDPEFESGDHSAYLNALTDSAEQNGYTPADVREGRVLLEGTHYGNARWVKAGDPLDPANSFPSVQEIRSHLERDVLRLGLDPEEAQVLCDLSVEKLVPNGDLVGVSPLLSDLPRLRMVQFDLGGPRGGLKLGFMRHWKSTDPDDATFGENLKRRIGEFMEKRRGRIKSLASTDRGARLLKEHWELVAYLDELLSRDLSDPVVAEEVAQAYLTKAFQLEPNGEHPFPGRFAGFVTYRELQAEARKRRKAVERAHHAEEKKAKDQVLREQRATAERERQIEKDRASRERIAKQRQDERRQFEEARGELGLLGGERLRDVLAAVSVSLGADRALTETEFAEAEAAMSALIAISDLAHANGPQSKLATKLANLLKVRVSQANSGDIENLDRSWRKWLDDSREANKLSLERARAEMLAQAVWPLSPKKNYPAWREQRDRFFRAMIEAEGFETRSRFLLDEKVASPRLIEHWIRGIRDHGPHPSGGWYAEVLLAERLGLASGLKVTGYEAESGDRRHGVPDFLVTHKGEGWSAFVESKSNVDQAERELFTGNLLANLQDATRELARGHQLDARPERVVWLRIVSEEPYSTDLRDRLGRELAVVLPEPSGHIRTLVVDVEAGERRGLFKAFVSDGVTWTEYQGGETLSPFLRAVWDPKDVLH